MKKLIIVLLGLNDLSCDDSLKQCTDKCEPTAK